MYIYMYIRMGMWVHTEVRFYVEYIDYVYIYVDVDVEVNDLCLDCIQALVGVRWSSTPNSLRIFHSLL